MQIDQLRTLLAVVEQRSFSRAAEALRVTQSTVSFHIKALEQAAGAHLLDRRGGKVRLSEAGKVLARYAAKILELRQEALARVHAEDSGARGHLRIAASTIPAEYLLPQALARFRRQHPGVAVSVEVSDTRRAAAALLAEECDLALLGAPLRDKRVVQTPFADDEIVLVGPRPNPWAPRGRLTLAQLREVPLLLREEGSGTQQMVGLGVSTHAGAPIHIGSTEALKRCALAGLGLAFLSRHAITDELRAGTLAVVALPGTPIRRRFLAARLRSATPSAAVQSMLSILSI